MKSNFTLIVTIFLIISFGIFSPVSAQWFPYVIDSTEVGADPNCAVDLDGDGDLDLVAPDYYGNKILWYENDNLIWRKNTIDISIGGPIIADSADIDGDGDPDIVTQGNSENKVVWYENNLPDTSWIQHDIGLLAGAEYVDVGDIDSDGDVDVAAVGWRANDVVWYENNLPVNIYAIVNGDQYDYADSILLYDDGQHHDSLSADNIYGNSKWLSDLEEDIYTIEVSSHDLIENIQYILPSTSTFTTIGPLVVDSVSAPRFSTFSPDRATFDVYLKNLGQISTAKDVSVRLNSDTSDFCLMGLQKLREYGDIEPLQRVSGRFTMTIDTTCLRDTIFSIPFTAKIASGDYEYWNDTNKVEVIISDIEEFSNVIPVDFNLKQNYPNPFNPKTIINYELPITNEVDLSIYNLLGQKVATLVSEKQKAGFHQVEWDASGFASGIYYYKIEAGEFVDVKKMVLLR